MKNWAIIHPPSGAIIATTSVAMPSAPAGFEILEAPVGILGERFWWDGTAFQPRLDAGVVTSTLCAAPGEPITLTAPTDAWVSRTDGNISNVHVFVVQGGYKQNRFTLVGKYRGSATVEVVNLAAAMDAVRAERDKRLFESDRFALPDFPIPEDVRAAWLEYRHILRQIPEQQPDATLATVVWPSPPESH